MYTLLPSQKGLGGMTGGLVIGWDVFAQLSSSLPSEQSSFPSQTQARGKHSHPVAQVKSFGEHLLHFVSFVVVVIIVEAVTTLLLFFGCVEEVLINCSEVIGLEIVPSRDSLAFVYGTVGVINSLVVFLFLFVVVSVCLT